MAIQPGKLGESRDEKSWEKRKKVGTKVFISGEKKMQIIKYKHILWFAFFVLQNFWLADPSRD